MPKQKFSKSGVWDKVSEVSTLIFEDIRISFKHSIGEVEGSYDAKSQLDLFICFYTTPTCDR